MRILVFVVCIAWPAVLHAQSAYNNHLVGDRSLGLAGAFVGLADDASAGFHNPAGLATLPGNAFSGSMWAVALESRTVDAGFHTSLGRTDLQDSIVRRMPFFAAGTLKLGRRDPAGVKPHALGVVVTQPFREEYRFAVQQEGMHADGYPIAGRLQMRHQQNSTWFGLSYAYRVSNQLSLGVTTFFTHHVLLHSESELLGATAANQDLVSAAIMGRSLDVEANSQHVLWRLGAIYDHSKQWRFGLMLQPPGSRLRGRGKVSQLRTHVDGEQSVFTIGESRDLHADAPRPWEVRMGGTWYRPKELWTLDLSLMGPVPDDDTFIQQVKEITGDDVRLPSNQEREVTLRSALGFEHVFGDSLPVRGGIMYERQGLRGTPSQSATFVPAVQNVLGLAAAVGYRTGDYDIAFGTVVTSGSGTALALDRAQTSEEPVFTSTNMRTRTMTLFVSGGARAARTIARGMFR